MSKHKQKLTSEQRTQRAQNAQKVIANARKPRLMIKDLPGWMQNAALNRFNWLRWLPFIPLLIVLLTAPMLQNEVPATLKATGGMINKNALFLVPFACLLGAYGCWIAIKSRRRADHVDGRKPVCIDGNGNHHRGPVGNTDLYCHLHLASLCGLSLEHYKMYIMLKVFTLYRKVLILADFL